jgi:enoyl-CoA hydratase/carnithine racemase
MNALNSTLMRELAAAVTAAEYLQQRFAATYG